LFQTQDLKGFTTTAGVIRGGGVARPASGAHQSQPSANQPRWIAPSTTVRRDVLSQDQANNDHVFRRIRGILNKITPEKFEKLSTDILELIGEGSNTIFKGVILLIFEKALDEPKYSSMYAQLCKRLSEHAPNFEPGDSKITTFKRLLLNKCKDEFENRAAVSSAFEKRAGGGVRLTESEEEARYLAKRKMLGNIKFIGELGKLEMLHDSILHRCAEQLLVGRRKQPVNDQTEDVECLAHLMKTCGRILDSPKAKMRMDQYFERIRALIANPEIPSRIKFLLQDVIEMRVNKWMPRKLATPDGPRTIQQVREDAARDGCIYLPQQDTPQEQQAKIPASNQLQEVIFSKSRPKGMEDIFGGPSDIGLNLGMGPGTIDGLHNTDNSYSNNNNNGYNGGGGYNDNWGGNSKFEEKYRENNSNYNNSDQRDFKDNYKKRDNFESKYAERPDFGDRFTANRNKTHPSNRGGRGTNGVASRGSPGFDGGRGNHGSVNNHQNGKDLPPRFNKMNFGSASDRIMDAPPLRPSPNSMMLKPKTPYSLPKSAMAKLDGINPVPSAKIDKVMMTSKEPALIIQKSSSNSKKGADKKNQGPTRDEVFGKINQILVKLVENQSTNEAFTSWKEIEIPAKMVNNALIHLLKGVIKQPLQESRQLSCQLMDQMYSNDLITAVQVRESLARLISGPGSNSGEQDAILAELAAWALETDKVKMSELAEITEGGGTHPLFLNILQLLAAKDQASLLSKFKEGCVKLLDQLPSNCRTEEQLGEELEQRKLTFLEPLLAIKADLWRQLEGGNNKPSSFLSWVQATVPKDHKTDSAFVSALVSAIVRYISETTTLATDNMNNQPDKDAVEKEKGLISSFKEVFQAFLTTQELQLLGVYALQVFCFSRGFPKGLILRWFVALYEADVVDEHVFLKWKDEVNDSYPGKGKALFQVNQWLTWLEEAESEDEDDDDE